jgi:aminoglycoside phosphotransferase (APT) family kinase protein
LRLAVVSGGMGVHNKLVCPCWKGDDQLPSLVVKFPRYPQYNYRVLAEYHALERVRGYLSPHPGAELAPRPLASTEIDGLCVTVETAWRGRSLLAHLRQGGAGPGGYLEKLYSLADWLATLHARSATPATSQQMRELVYAPLESAGAEFNLSAQEKDALAHLRDRACEMADSTPLPVVFNHNDLNTMNVLVGESGELTQVIDWDAAGPDCPRLTLSTS